MESRESSRPRGTRQSLAIVFLVIGFVLLLMSLAAWMTRAPLLP